jgi:hypothetical protein
MLTEGKRLAVYSIRATKGGSVWVRAGAAFVNKDGSLNVSLDVLPIDGRLHVREAGERSERKDAGKPPAPDRTELGGEVSHAMHAAVQP